MFFIIIKINRASYSTVNKLISIIHYSLLLLQSLLFLLLIVGIAKQLPIDAFSHLDEQLLIHLVILGARVEVDVDFELSRVAEDARVLQRDLNYIVHHKDLAIGRRRQK